MKSICCLFALIVISAASTIPMPSNGRLPVGAPQPHPALFRVARATEVPESPKDSSTKQEVVESSADDMDKAETFGFGFHKHIHISPSYGGYYGGGYYPSYPYAYNYGYNYPYYY
ncbi:uncharacterized protein LOC131687935 [Topomyia yanbarensis]|uniref:uncharacterized protein LOC131687935 n=1 Tax=Topomyia yanbarensis TaxID=2498891 RepID=UPI00273CB76E|nr:uncharacterized protein LOC131687935 [Topomyia yanbarensis]